MLPRLRAWSAGHGICCIFNLHAYQVNVMSTTSVFLIVYGVGVVVNAIGAASIWDDLMEAARENPHGGRRVLRRRIVRNVGVYDFIPALVRSQDSVQKAKRQ